MENRYKSLEDFGLTKEMIDFLNQYLLKYHDKSDDSITEEFAKKYDLDKEFAREIERNYVVVNRSRIYKKIENLLIADWEEGEIINQLNLDFGLDRTDAEKYIFRTKLDRLDKISPSIVGRADGREEQNRQKEKSDFKRLGGA